MRTATLILTLFALSASGLAAATTPASKAAPKKAAAKPTARKITAKRIAPKRKAAPTKSAAKKITPKRITPAKRATTTKKAAPRKITAKKVAPKRIAPRKTTTARRAPTKRRSTRAKATPVKFTPGERTLAPISCSTNETAPDAVALCTDCPDHALSEAYALLGLKYRRGGTSEETGMDCSGFTQHVFKQSCGVELPRSASQQFEVGVPTAKEDLARGDLVFFRSRRGWHVGIYTGDGNFIHSPNRRSSVKISSLSAAYYKRAYLGARRLTQNLIEAPAIDPPTLEPLPDTPTFTEAGENAADGENGATGEGESPDANGNGVN